MKTTSEKLTALRQAAKERPIRVMIIGLGSVGHYLLDDLMSTADEGIALFVAGRSADKMASDVNIIRVASMIRGQNRSPVTVVGGVDLNDTNAVADALARVKPDIIVNSSRAYAGLKYGSISWKALRAYGIWAPLSIRYVKNIMAACKAAESDAVVINTSYSDAVIPWLKSAGYAYPDFGSGNINHLVYRFKLAAGELLALPDPWNIDITFAVSHFHDVCISKEGHTEGQKMLIDMRYHGKPLPLDIETIIAHCGIPMPTDAKRNMMNAASNFEIIEGILAAVREGKKVKLHCPGAFGEIGGYPVTLDGGGDAVTASICEEVFDLAAMRAKNRESIYLDGIEAIEHGSLFYTDELLFKVKAAFGVTLPKEVPFDAIEATADLLVKEIIEKYKS